MSNWTQSGYDPSEHNFHKGVIDNSPNEGYPQNYFFSDTIRSVVIGFGNYFNDLYVIRYDEHGEPIKKIQVPLKYGPRMKSHDFRVEQESGKKYYIPLPNIYYKIDSISFAGDRYAGAGEVRAFYSNYFEKNGIDYVMANKFWSDIQPVPYNITFSMDAKVEYMSDINQIMEQILVRFAPESYIHLKEFWFVNKRRTIKIKCDSTNIDMNTEFGEEDKREITGTFTFTVEAFLYKPIQNSYIIDQIIMDLYTKDNKEVYKEVIKGNYDPYGNSLEYDADRLLKERYNFSYEFGTKIGYVSALKPFEEQPIPIYSGNCIIQKYEYDTTPEVTNYPTGSKMLRSMSSFADSDQSVWNSYNHIFSLTGQASVQKIGEPGPSATKWKENYYMVTGNSLDDICSSGNKIWQFLYNPSFANTSAEPNTYGGTIIKEFDNLHGFGDFNPDSNHYFLSKDIILNGEVIKNAQIAISSTIEKNNTKL